MDSSSSPEKTSMDPSMEMDPSIDPSIDPSLLLSDTLIVAVIGKRFALLGTDSLATIGDLNWTGSTSSSKTFKLHDNIFMAGSGYTGCRHALERSLKLNPYPSKVRSIKALVDFVVKRINDEFCQVWNNENRYVDLLVAGNLLGKDTYHTYLIHKPGTSYEVVKLKGRTQAMGSGATKEIKAYLDLFRETDDVETATRLVFDVLRKSTLSCSGVGGNLQVITIRKDFAIKSVVEQEDPLDCTSPYTTRTDTIMDPNDSHQISVTYQI